MATAAELGETRKLWNDLLGCARRDKIARLVGDAHNGVGVPDIDPLGVVRWIERDPEGKVEAGRGEGRDRLRFAVGANPS